MNYIHHLNSAFFKIYEDDRLTPSHFSLYMALFQQWNFNGFPEKMFISRNEVMRQSKIGSKSNYHSRIRDLDKWGYLRYYPSKDPFKGSMIKMVIFRDRKRKGNSHTLEHIKGFQVEEQSTTNCNSFQGQASLLEDSGTGLVPVQHNPLPGQDEIQHNPFSEQVTVQQNPNTGHVGVPNTNMYKHKNMPTGKPGSEEEVLKHFDLCKSNSIEAAKFLNYYSSRGWNTSGGFPIRNWKKMAEMWIARSSEGPALSSYADNLRTFNDKDYDEPL